MTEREAWSYLAGIIDGEGCVYFRPQGLHRIITISTTEKDLLEGYCGVLDFLDIKYLVQVQRKTQKPEHAICFDIRIHHFEGFVAIYENCPLRSKRKRLKLEQILLSYTRRTYNPLTSVKEG